MFAANNDPISDAMAVRAGITNLVKSGLFADAIQDWRKEPEAYRTLPQFYTDFRKTEAERQRLLTTKTAGYRHKAAAAIEDNNNMALATNNKQRPSNNIILLLDTWCRSQ
jgi:hypothetical protein